MSARKPLHRAAALLTLLGGAAAVGFFAPSCANPVQDAQIAALGPEVAGVPTGPEHRPGQPCLVCHSKYGGATPFVVAGTIFADAPGLTKTFKPVAGVDVVFTDAIGNSQTATTGCNGNFNIPASGWNARFPLAVEIHYPVYDPTTHKIQQMPDPKDPSGGTMIDVQKVKAMGSVISRDGSCAHCHQLTGRAPATDAMGTVLDYPSTGWVYCNASGDSNFFPDPDPSCAGKPPPPVGSSPSTSSSTATTGAGG